MLQLWLEFSLWPGNFHMLQVQPLKEKKALSNRKSRLPGPRGRMIKKNYCLGREIPFIKFRMKLSRRKYMCLGKIRVKLIYCETAKKRMT